MLADDAVVHIRRDDQIAVRNGHCAVNRIKLSGIAGSQNPRAVGSQLTHTDRTSIAEIHQDRRLAHEQNSRRIAVKFIRQEDITQALAVIERCVVKLGQCLRNSQCHQALIVAERIAAKTDDTERNLELCLIRHFRECKRCNHRMHAHFFQALIEIRTGSAQFQREHALFVDRLEVRRNNAHDTCGRRLLVMLHDTGQPVDGNLDRTVQNIRKLIFKPLRDRDRIQIRTAGKRTAADHLYRLRNPQADKRVAVCKRVFIDHAQCLRQTNLLILTRRSKCIRSDVGNRIRQNQTERTRAAGKRIHLDDSESFGNYDMPDGFDAAECIGTDSADTLRQDHGRQDMLRLLSAQIKFFHAVRRNCGAAFGQLQNMIANRELLDLLCGQDVLILLHQIGNCFNARSGKDFLLRPVQLDLRTIKEQINRFFVRIICRQIDIRQAGTACKSIRLDLGQRIRDLNCHQARAIPECLRFHAADALRNLKPLTRFCIAECTACDYSISLQRIAALNRSGQRFANIMGKDFLVLRVFTNMNRDKRNSIIVNFFRECDGCGLLHRSLLLIYNSIWLRCFNRLRLDRNHRLCCNRRSCFRRIHRSGYRLLNSCVFSRSSLHRDCRLCGDLSGKCRLCRCVNSLRAGKCLDLLLQFRQYA